MRSLFNKGEKVYCLDANIFIEAWTKHYAPNRTSNYWEILDGLAKNGRVFSPLEVKKELERKEDNLKKWVSAKGYFFKEPDERVTSAVAEILEEFDELVDNIKGRSIADPWVIAHAEVERATVVTKEEMGIGKRIKIPNVCAARGVPYMGEFEFLDEVGVKFAAHK